MRKKDRYNLFSTIVNMLIVLIVGMILNDYITAKQCDNNNKFHTPLFGDFSCERIEE